jgi:hypothetical protein
MGDCPAASLVIVAELHRNFRLAPRRAVLPRGAAGLSKHRKSHLIRVCVLDDEPFQLSPALRDD